MTRARPAPLSAALRLAASATTAIGLLTLSTPGAAQDSSPVVKPTEAQVQLYEKATEAYKAGDYAKAIELLRSSLALGELNLVYLNLGRSLFRAGQCDAAEQAYAKALTAPRVPDLSAEAVAGKVKEYRVELESCPGILTTVCSPSDMTVSIDGGAPIPCGQEVTLTPGDHTLIATNGTLSSQARVTIVAHKRSRVELTATPAVVKDPGPGPGQTPPRSTSPLLVGGAIALGVGILSGTTGAIIDQTVLGDSIGQLQDAILANDEMAREEAREDADFFQTTVLGLYITSGVGVVGGLVLIALGLVDAPAQEAPPTSTGLVPLLTPDTAGAAWQLRW